MMRFTEQHGLFNNRCRQGHWQWCSDGCWWARLNADSGARVDACWSHNLAAVIVERWNSGQVRWQRWEFLPFGTFRGHRQLRLGTKNVQLGHDHTNFGAHLVRESVQDFRLIEAWQLATRWLWAAWVHRQRLWSADRHDWRWWSADRSGLTTVVTTKKAANQIIGTTERHSLRVEGHGGEDDHRDDWFDGHFFGCRIVERWLEQVL